jgi:sugar phosphate isomerase/epimerase
MLLLSTKSLLGYWLHKIFLLTKSAAYDGIDLSLDFENFDSIDATYIDSLIRSTDVPVMSITAPAKKLTKKQFEKILSIADELSIPLVNVHPPHRLEKEKDWFGEYLQWALKKYPHITIHVINAPPKTWLFLISEYWDARPETIKKITEHTALSIANVDPSSGVDLMKTFVLLGSTMWLVYLSDKDEEHIHMFPGEGTMPIESLLIKLSELEYSGHFTLDIDPEYLEAGNDERVLERLSDAKNFLSKYFKNRVSS